jgi:hypothetical protein
MCLINNRSLSRVKNEIYSYLDDKIVKSDRMVTLLVEFIVKKPLVSGPAT